MQLCSRRRFCCHFLLQFATLDDAIAIYAASSRNFGCRRVDDLAYTKALGLHTHQQQAQAMSLCARAPRIAAMRSR